MRCYIFACDSTFTTKGHATCETWLDLKVTSSLPHTAVHCFHLHWKRLTSTVGLNWVSVMYNLPARRGYPTVHVCRCIIWVCWDLITITASKILFKWNCSQKTMADTSSRRLFLFSAHQQREANSCFHDGRQEGRKMCCFLTPLYVVGSYE